MADFIVIILIVAAVFWAIRFIRKQKKKGSGCSGCPYAGNCGGGCSQKTPKKDNN